MRGLIFRGLRAAAVAGVAVYAVCAAYVLTRREEMFFERFPASYTETECRFLNIGSEGSRIAFVYLRNPGARRCLLYSHGSASDLGTLGPILEAHRAFGFNVLAYDYPGVGLSTGPLSESACDAAAEALFAWLRREGVAAEDIVLYGRSIGVTPTIRLAARERCGSVVLASGFVSAFGHRPWMRLFPGDWFRNRERIGAMRSPALILHGERDERIDAANAGMLAEAAPAGSVARIIAGRGHGDLHLDPAYWRAIAGWLGGRAVRRHADVSPAGASGSPP